MTSCSKVEEEIEVEDDRQKNSLRETDKILTALEAMPMHLNWGKIFSLLDKHTNHGCHLAEPENLY